MENHVSIETAIKLRDAGFPQPEPKTGQFWQCQDSIPIAAGSVEFDRFKTWGEDLIFLPTAMDILRQFPGCNDIFWDGVSFFCNEHQHENPAECAAAAWLEIKWDDPNKSVSFGITIM